MEGNPVGSEFQVVILAGGTGSRLPPLTENYPKALLPIANQPMVRYCLASLEKLGFREAILIAKMDHRDLLGRFITERLEGTIQLDIHWIEEDCGTADSLRQIKDKIKKDFLVVSSDFVTDIPLHHLIDLHRVHASTCTALLYDLPKTDDGKKAKFEAGLLEYFGFVKNRLVFDISAADVEEELEVRNSLLKKFPNVTIQTNLLGAHFFIFKKWVIDLVAEKKSISSIQSELVPFLVNSQWRTSPKYSISQVAAESSQEDLISISASYLKSEPVKCYVYKPPGGFCGRANTLASYLEINRQVLKGACSSIPITKIHPDSHLDPKAQVGGDSMVGNGTKVGEKTSVKRSVIGDHCTIGKNVKISNCVIMDHVTIEDGCQLEGVTACNNSKLKESCVLKDCEVALGASVEKGVNAKGEKFTIVE